MHFIKRIAFLGLFLLLFLPFGLVFADSQFNQGEVQLSVGSFLLNIEENPGIIDQIDFNGSSFTITVSSSQRIKISSSDRVNFAFDPQSAAPYITRTCETTKSTIKIETPSISSLAITITPSGTCVPGGGEGGGGAGGGLGTLVPPPPPTPPGSPPPPPPILLEPPGGVPGVLTPPAPAPAPAPTVIPPTPPLIIPPIIPEIVKETITETIEAVIDIAVGVTNITQSIFQGDFSLAQDILNGLRANTTVTNSIKQIFEPLLAIVGVFGATMLALTAIQASASLAINASALLQFLDLSRVFSLGLLQFKKRNPWGRILEKLTGKPVPAALVQIFDAEFKKLKDSQLTDKDGRFGSLVGLGKYFIKVTKDGFLNKETETLTITAEKQAINLEIIITPIDQEFSLDYLKKVNYLDVVKRLLDSVSPVLLVIGTVFSFIALIIVPTTLNYIIFTVYIALDILKIYFIYHFVKPFGKVLDSESSQPLTLSIVRVFDFEKHMLLSTKATDDEGRFNFLVAPGNYYLTCVKAGYAPFRSEPMMVTKAGLEATDIKLQKAGVVPPPAPFVPPRPTEGLGPTPPAPPAAPALPPTPPQPPATQ